MRRRVFLNQDFIAASRHFVCVRLNAWLDERNVTRIVKLQGAHQNSCLALVAPDAPGVAADSFPAGKDCFWGPLDFNGSDKDAPWDEVSRHLRWLPEAMRKLTVQYPGKPAETDSRPVLPVFPDLTQALNIAACDCEAVVVLVADGEAAAALDGPMLLTIEAPHVAGRAHVIRATPEVWRAALASGQIEAPGFEAAEVGGTGICVVGPDPYGLKGTLLAHVAGVPTAEGLLPVLHDGLDRFAAGFRKLDRSSHIIEGRREGVRWKEFQPKDWRSLLDEPATAPPAEGGDT